MYYKYTGSISSFSIQKPKDVSVADIMLWNCSDRTIAPTRIQAFGKLADYINDLEWTDDEERYIEQDFYYDENLTLAYIVIPAFGESRIPAKIIASSDAPWMRDAFRIFGTIEHINTSHPEPMSGNEYSDWCDYKYEHFRRS